MKWSRGRTLARAPEMRQARRLAILAFLALRCRDDDSNTLKFSTAVRPIYAVLRPKVQAAAKIVDESPARFHNPNPCSTNIRYSQRIMSCLLLLFLRGLMQKYALQKIEPKQFGANGPAVGETSPAIISAEGERGALF